MGETLGKVPGLYAPVIGLFYFPFPPSFTVTVPFKGSFEEMTREPVVEPAAAGVKVS